MPWATLLVNLLGSFALGMLLGERLERDWERWSCSSALVSGSFTTMSTFSMELVQMVDRGRRPRIIASAALNLLAPVMAVRMDAHRRPIGHWERSDPPTRSIRRRRITPIGERITASTNTVPMRFMSN